MFTTCWLALTPPAAVHCVSNHRVWWGYPYAHMAVARSPCAASGLGPAPVGALLARFYPASAVATTVFLDLCVGSLAYRRSLPRMPTPFRALPPPEPLRPPTDALAAPALHAMDPTEPETAAYLDWVLRCAHILTCDACWARFGHFPPPDAPVRRFLAQQAGTARFEAFARRLSGFAPDPTHMLAQLDAYNLLEQHDQQQERDRHERFAAILATLHPEP